MANLDSTQLPDGNWYFVSKLVNNELNSGINYWWILITSMLFSTFSFIVAYLSIVLLPDDENKCKNIFKVRGFKPATDLYLNGENSHFGPDLTNLKSKDLLNVQADMFLEHPE